MPFIGKTPETGAFRLIDSITTSATDTYALTVLGDHYFPESARNLIVSLNGVTQAPETAYTVSGSHIVFASALTSSDVIDYILVIGDAVDIGTPSDGTVGNAQLKASLDLSGKTLTFTNDQISGDYVHGGTISNFASTGIDDNATSTKLTVSDTGIDVTGTVVADVLTIQGSAQNIAQIETSGSTGSYITFRDADTTAGQRAWLGADADLFKLYSNNSTLNITMKSDGSNNGLTGINNANPSAALDVAGTIKGDSTFLLSNATTSSFLQVSSNILQLGTSSSDPVVFYANNAERTRITSDGNFGVGTPSPTTKLHVQNSAVSPSWSAYAGTTLTLEDASNQGNILQFVSPSSYTGEVWFGDGDSRNSGRIRYEHNLDKMEFWTSGTERFSVESDGALHAKSSNTGTNPAANAHIASELRFFNTSATDNNLNAIGFYNSNELIDARIAAVHKSHSARQGELSFMTHSGSALEERLRIESNGNTAIKANGGEIRFTGHSIYRAGGFGSGLHFTTNAVIPVNENGSVSDNTESLGTPSYRWQYLYLSGGVHLGGTASPNYLDDYEEGNWYPTITGNSGATGQSYSVQVGLYVKIGNTVNFSFDVGLSNAGTLSGTYVVLGGLPFSTAGSNVGGGLFVSYLSGVSSSVNKPVGAYIHSGNAYLMETGAEADYFQVAEGKHGNSMRMIGWGQLMI
jgi:hypothetical protein